MAKRAPVGEGTYNPLDMGLAQSVIHGPAKRIPEGRSLQEEATQRHHPLDVPSGKMASISRPDVSASEPRGTRSLHREKRVLLTPEEERDIERLVDRIGEQLTTPLKLSHLLRACMAVLCHAETELLHRAMELRPLSRPANGDPVALARFEQALAILLSSALRDAPIVR